MNFRRVMLQDFDMSGGQHLATLSGVAGEVLADVPRIKEFGFTSSPAPGAAHGVALSLGGRSSRAMVFGLDNPAVNPQLGAGQTAIYDGAGNVISLVSAKIRIVSVGTIELVSAGALTHNGVNIGATHVHSGVVAGSATTEGPQ